MVIINKIKRQKKLESIYRKRFIFGESVNKDNNDKNKYESFLKENIDIILLSYSFLEIYIEFYQNVIEEIFEDLYLLLLYI